MNPSPFKKLDDSATKKFSLKMTIEEMHTRISLTPPHFDWLSQRLLDQVFHSAQGRMFDIHYIIPVRLADPNFALQLGNYLEELF